MLLHATCQLLKVYGAADAALSQLQEAGSALQVSMMPTRASIWLSLQGVCASGRWPAVDALCLQSQPERHALCKHAKTSAVRQALVLTQASPAQEQLQNRLIESSEVDDAVTCLPDSPPTVFRRLTTKPTMQCNATS